MCCSILDIHDISAACSTVSVTPIDFSVGPCTCADAYKIVFITLIVAHQCLTLFPSIALIIVMNILCFWNRVCNFVDASIKNTSFSAPKCQLFFHALFGRTGTLQDPCIRGKHLPLHQTPQYLTSWTISYSYCSNHNCLF